MARAVDGVLLWQVACEFVAASRKLSPQGFRASEAILQRAKVLHLTHSVDLKIINPFN